MCVKNTITRIIPIKQLILKNSPKKMAITIHTQYHQPLLSSHKFSTKNSQKKSIFLINYTKTHVRNLINHKTHIPKLRFALTESDSPKSLNSDPQFLLQQLGESFDLPSDYFEKLPRDLRLDLNDAAFDLSNGPVLIECGQELGETLLELSRAWQLADTSTSYSLAKKLPLLADTLRESEKSALGKRLVSAGRRFQSMGKYGQGELQTIAKSMIDAGKLLAASVPNATEELRNPETRTFKFGELQVELSPEKAYVGAVIAVGFGFLSWQVSQGIQNIPENSLQYANDNALLLAKSLRGTLLAVFYSSALLSGFSAIGLVLLAQQLKSKDK
ncbi:hypothetical protein RND81_04G215900 [Saponaria officinalis]|uniref:Uncharacterized protein n=1 Tax=Saponaria officinalis TaxID=3572 RepID=A0AAW1LM26_SAPOF